MTIILVNFMLLVCSALQCAQKVNRLIVVDPFIVKFATELIEIADWVTFG